MSNANDIAMNYLTTAVVENMGGDQWRVSVYANGALQYRAWFASESAADYYAARVRLG